MAKILHTGDWHVGRDLLRCGRAQDFDEVLAQIVMHAKNSEPDLIIHCGDVFDGPRPGVDDMHRALDALQQLAQIAPTLVLAGNHDSQQLFRVFNVLRVGDNRLRFIERARHPRDGGIIDVETVDGERIRVAPVPFIYANRQVDFFGDPTKFMGTYAQRMGLINEELAKGLRDGYDGRRDILIYAAHLYVTGAHLARSERQVHVTDVYAAQKETLPPVDYVALGHIHKPQNLAGTLSGRYVGSPLQIDFGEEGEAKSLTLIDARPGRPPEIALLKLDAGRPLRSLRGTLEQIKAVAPTVGNAIVKVVVETENPIDDLADQVCALLPNATLADLQQAIASQKLQALTHEPLADGNQQGIIELLDEYLKEKGTRGANATHVRDLFVALYDSDDDGPLAERIAGTAELLAAELPDPPPIIEFGEDDDAILETEAA